MTEEQFQQIMTALGNIEEAVKAIDVPQPESVYLEVHDIRDEVSEIKRMLREE